MDGLRSLARDQSREQARVYDVQTLIQGVYGLLHEIYKKEGINLVFESPVQNNIKVKVRFGAVQQVLMNLIGNARDALNSSTTKNITVNVEYVKDDILINVRDTGCGIAQQNIENIFKAFYTTKEVGKGTGLGLSISKKIIQDEGGDINVVSVLDKGTTFSIRLPAYIEKEKVQSKVESNPVDVKKTTKVELKNKVALIVDDEHEIRRILRYILTREGMTVVEAVDGEDAWNIWQKQHFDFLVTDLNMPKLNGPQLIARIIHQNTKNASIFVLTGGVQNDWNIVEGLDISSAITNIIPKPFTIDLLLQTLTTGRGA